MVVVFLLFDGPSYDNANFLKSL
uniref:Uncharacterized protein n=1 Tax=Anguilla anguilla TaxID=7936 RepID=A0A0E9Q7T9_ANGAN